MKRRFGTLVSLTTATLLAAGCGLFSKPTGPSSDNDGPTSGIGFFGRIGGESFYQFELSDPTYTWQVNWYDEYMAVGGVIGGAETVAQTEELVDGVWTFISTQSYAWDWDGYTDLAPDGVIVTMWTSRKWESREPCMVW